MSTTISWAILAGTEANWKGPWFEPQNLQTAGGGTGVGEEHDNVITAHGGGGGHLHVGVGNGVEFPGDGGEHMGTFAGQDHRAAAADAHDMGGILQ